MTAIATAAATPTSSTPPANAACCVVIVHYRGAADTLAAVASVRTHAPMVPTIVVDNASPDGSGSELAAAFAGAKDITLLCSPTNGGFGAGCNRGIDFAMRTFPAVQQLLLLNPDAQLTAGALATMQQTAQRHPEAGAVGCRIVRPDGSVWFENGRFPHWTLSRFHCRAPIDGREFASDFITGCCMLLAATLLQQGLHFDERFFLYGEDADLCCAVRDRGRTLWITRDATVVHRGGGSQSGPPVLGELTAAQVYWLVRSKVLLARKRLRWPQRLVFYAMAALAKPLLALLSGRGGRWLRPYFAGLCGRTPPR